MSPVLQFLLAVGVIILAAKVGGVISQRLGQPSVLGKLLSGLLLGPSLFNLLHLSLFTEAHLIEESIGFMAEIGVILLMFIAGLEVELSEMRRAGRVAILSGVLGVAVPLTLGLGVALAIGYSWSQSLFIGIILSATSVSISAQTLMELGVLRSRVGVALLGAAVVDDLLVILILSLFLALATGGGGAGDVLLVLAKMTGYLVVSILVGLWAIPRLLPRVDRLRVSEPLVSFALIVTLLYAWTAEVLGGVALITGAFIAGVLFGRTPLRHTLERRVHTLAYAFFVPIFFASIGLEADVRLVTGAIIWFALAILVVAVVGKIGGAGLAAKWAGYTGQEALQVGLGMVSRGEVGLIVASVGITAGVIGDDVFAVTVLMVLVTTLITPLLLRWSMQRPPRLRDVPSPKPEL